MWLRVMQIVSYGAGVMSALCDRLHFPHDASARCARGAESIHTILGARRESLYELLGPPVAVGAHPIYETWYYPFDPDQQIAIAIQFDRRAVRHVKLIQAPSK